MKKETGRQLIAKDRINALFEQAVLRPVFASRYVILARKMSSRHKVRIPSRWSRSFCKECNAFWIPGKNCMIRKRPGRLVFHCLKCNSVRRFEVR